MADAIVTEDTGFKPEPVPDNIADTELVGLNPTETSTEEQQVETSNEETPQDQPEVEETEDEEPDTPVEEEAEQPEHTEEKPANEPTVDRKRHNEEMAAARVQAKQQRNFVNEQRQQIREYETTNDMDDIKNQLEVIKANQYVDTVERNRSSLLNENLRAQTEIPLFTPGTTEWRQGGEAVYWAALNRFNDSYTVTDPETGEVLGAMDRNGNSVSLLNYLQQEAATMSQVLGTTQATSQRQAQKSEAKMRAKVVTPTNAGKTTSSGDELQDLLDKVGDIPLY